MKLYSFVAVLISVVMTVCSAFAEELHMNEPIHISKELTSPFLRLVIDADVTSVETGTRLPTYETNYPPSDREAWLEVFFGDPQAEVVDSFAGKSKEALLSNLITDADRERAYSLGNKHTRYQSYFCALVYSTTEQEIGRNIPLAIENAQANGIALHPQQAREIAQNWIDQLSSRLGWKDFIWSHTYALPPNDGQAVEHLENYIATGIYLVEYERFLSGIPIARDLLPNSEVEGDVLQLYIDDSGILRMDGICRSYAEHGSAVVNISLEEALVILEENMDYISAFPDNSRDGFMIQEVGLCYRLIPKLNGDDIDYHAIMTVRPAWRFASGICRNQTNVFVMYIDAETGEVLE